MDDIVARIYNGYCEHVRLTGKRPDKLILDERSHYQLWERVFRNIIIIDPVRPPSYMGMEIEIDNSLEGMYLAGSSCMSNAITGRQANMTIFDDLMLADNDKADWEAKGWEHLQYVDGKLWGIPPGAVMPIPVTE